MALITGGGGEFWRIGGPGDDIMVMAVSTTPTDARFYNGRQFTNSDMHGTGVGTMVMAGGSGDDDLSTAIRFNPFDSEGNPMYRTLYGGSFLAGSERFPDGFNTPVQGTLGKAGNLSGNNIRFDGDDTLRGGAFDILKGGTGAGDGGRGDKYEGHGPIPVDQAMQVPFFDFGGYEPDFLFMDIHKSRAHPDGFEVHDVAIHSRGETAGGRDYVVLKEVLVDFPNPLFSRAVDLGSREDGRADEGHHDVFVFYKGRSYVDEVEDLLRDAMVSSNPDGGYNYQFLHDYYG